MDDGALLLRVGLGRKHDVGVLGDGRREKCRVRDHGPGGRQRALPQARGRQLAHGVALQQVERAQLAVGQRLRDRDRIGRVKLAAAGAGVVRAGQRRADHRGRRRESRAGVRQHSGLTQAAPVGAGRQLQQARAVGAGKRKALGDREQRPGGSRSVGPCGEPLAPQDHHLARSRPAPRSGRRGRVPLLRAAQQRHQLAHRARLGTGGQRELLVLLVGKCRAQRPNECRSRSGRVAHRQRCAGIERARARGSHGEPQPVPAHALAQAQVEDRRVVDRLGVEHEHRVRELQVGGARR